MSNAKPEVIVFTDGACSGNPGPGGWAYILRDLASGEEMRAAGAESDTTNNRMEMLSVIEALAGLTTPSKVQLVTDSNYVAKGISEWLPGWKKKGWKRFDGKKLVPIKNLELWQRLDGLLATHQVTTRWIKGHAGHAENEECDRMAVEACERIMRGEVVNGTPRSTTEPPKPLAELEPGYSRRVSYSGPSPITYMMEQGVANPGIISLAAGLVDQETLPVEETRRAIEAVLSDPVRARAALQYGTTDGDRQLRDALCRNLANLDGKSPAAMGLSADRVIVGTGSQQLLYLAAECLIDPGDIVLLGVPAYFVFMGALESFGARIEPVETDGEGLIPEAVEAALRRLETSRELDRVKLIYDVSYFNNPTGLSLSAPRRAALVDVAKRWSRRHRIMILEDAAYRELRYRGPELPSMLSFDEEGRHVLYAGTFSKPFSPGMKTGYLVVPRDLREPLMRQKGHHDFGSANFTQALILEAMASGDYLRHLETLRDLYCRKLDAMLSILSEELASHAKEMTWTRPDGGLYVWAELPQKIHTTRGEPFFEACLRAGALYVPGEYCYPTGAANVPRSTLRLSFGNQPIERLVEGVRRLAGVIRTALDR